MTTSAEIMLKTMKALGLTVDMNVTRIVIDMRHDKPTKVYYECFGDEKLLNIEWGIGLGEIKAERPQAKNTASQNLYALCKMHKWTVQVISYSPVAEEKWKVTVSIMCFNCAMTRNFQALFKAKSIEQLRQQVYFEPDAGIEIEKLNGWCEIDD